MPDLFGATPGPGRGGAGATGTEGAEERTWRARREAANSHGPSRRTDGSQPGRKHRVAGESGSDRRAPADRVARAGSSGGGYRFAGGRFPGPVRALAAAAVVIATVTAIASRSDPHQPTAAPEPAGPRGHTAGRPKGDRDRLPATPGIPSPSAGRAGEPSHLSRARRGHNRRESKDVQAPTSPASPPAPPPAAPPPAVLPPAQSEKDVTPPPTVAPSRPAPPARKAPALPAPVPPGSPPEFL
jgi:hypothetical protein